MSVKKWFKSKKSSKDSLFRLEQMQFLHKNDESENDPPYSRWMNEWEDQSQVSHLPINPFKFPFLNNKSCEIWFCQVQEEVIDHKKAKKCKELKRK
jgi:hypothetical protein